jgi:CubicO group peptidase (beta-lactamase class C family)
MQARSGIYHKAAYEPIGLDARRPARESHEPGEYWFYNNWDFNVLGTILERASGLDVFGAFDQWFARALQMQDFVPDACSTFFENASEHPAHLFTISARDLARFGHLYLCRGAWARARLLPAEWVVESLRPHSAAAHGYETYATGFGLLWWTLRPELLGGLRAHAALGGSGHGVLLLPELDAVIVHQNDGEATAPGWTEILPVLAQIADLSREARSLTRSTPGR